MGTSRPIVAIVGSARPEILAGNETSARAVSLSPVQASSIVTT